MKQKEENTHNSMNEKKLNDDNHTTKSIIKFQLNPNIKQSDHKNDPITQ